MRSLDESKPKVGVGFRPEVIDWITQSLDLLDVVEVTAEHYIYGSRRVRAAIEALPRRVAVVTHGVTLSLGTAVQPDRSFLREIAAFLRVVRAPWFSEHLAFTKTPSRDVSLLLPLVRTKDMLEVVLENLAVVREELGAPMLLENVAYYYEYSGSCMSEFDFMVQALTQSNSSLLLDVENLRINAANHGYDALAVLRALPKGLVRAVHVAGGTVLRGMQVDTHSVPISDQTLALLGELLRFQRPDSIIVERDQGFDDVSDVLDDVRRIRRVIDRGSLS